MASTGTVFETDLPGVPLHSRGKVRDVYSAGEYLVIVASDRLSAFDYILPTPIPGKGNVLTQLTLFWLSRMGDVVPNHFVSADVSRYPDPFPRFASQLEGRSMLVRRARMIDIECVARGYVAGSGWKDYRRTGEICGIGLPEGMLESGKLPAPIFTPATKASAGHDENISYENVVMHVGADLAQRLRSLTLGIYERAANYAETRGILLADTKFEFGFVGDELVLADEVLTPDSSRFWPKDAYRPGGPQPSYDKQFVRDYLESIGWAKQPPAPALPPDVVEKTSEKYHEAYRLLTGRTL